jgi:hypothetical protein
MPCKACTDRRLVYNARERIFSVICAISTLDERPRIFIRDKPILSSERMLHMDCYRKGSVERTLEMSLKGFDAKTTASRKVMLTLTRG